MSLKYEPASEPLHIAVSHSHAPTGLTNLERHLFQTIPELTFHTVGYEGFVWAGFRGVT